MSLSISDGGGAHEAFEGTPLLVDTSLWSSSFPMPDLSFLGIDTKGFSAHTRDPDMPINMAIFGTGPRSLRRVTGITVQSRFMGGIRKLEVRCSDETESPVQVGAHDTERINNQAKEFTVDYANGEYIVGIRTFYVETGWFLGFEVRPLSSLTAVKIHVAGSRG